MSIISFICALKTLSESKVFVNCPFKIFSSFAKNILTVSFIRVLTESALK